MAVQIISLVIALIAVIVGPIVTYKLTKKKLEFQFRTLIREKWVDKLEENVISYLTLVLEWVEKYRGILDGSSKTKEPEKEIDRMLDLINSSFVKLQLHLNNKKPLQNEILSKVIIMKNLINKKSFEENIITELRECHDTIIEKLKIILQEERSQIIKIFK